MARATPTESANPRDFSVVKKVSTFSDKRTSYEKKT
jgi:hypothetical protein